MVDIADDPEAMRLVRQLHRMGYGPEQVGAGVILAQLAADAPEPVVTHSPWQLGPSGHSWRRTSAGVVECSFDTGPHEVGDVPLADVPLVAALLDAIARGIPITERVANA